MIFLMDLYKSLENVDASAEENVNDRYQASK